MKSQTKEISASDLLKGLLCTRVDSLAVENTSFSWVTSDSRKVLPGSLFVALTGGEYDGHDFIEKAVESGSTGVVVVRNKLTAERIKGLEVPVYEVTNSGEAYAKLAANFYGQSAEEMLFIGITGTNGKTTITYLVEEVLLGVGKSVGVIGTVNNRYTLAGGKKTVLPTRFTTPEAMELQAVLAEMVKNEVELVVMEVSSHALAQARVEGLLYQVGAFTNLSRDHLDYHQDMEDYFLAKTRLFTHHMVENGVVVLPTASDQGEKREWLHTLNTICKERDFLLSTWGEEKTSSVRLIQTEASLDKTEIRIATKSGEHCIATPMVGDYNVENLLTAYTICSSLGIDDKVICQQLGRTRGAPGRLERVKPEFWKSRGPEVFVDYAHTPDALEKALTTLKALPHGDLFCVFGCGGDRDQGKRPLMGEIACRLADVAIVTDDNPRTENPDTIITQIVKGIEATSTEVFDQNWLGKRVENEQGCVVVRNRKEAIESAIVAAKVGDIVLIAGKGHEPYQLGSHGKKFFDDRLEATEALLNWTDDLVADAVGGVLHSCKTERTFLGQVSTDSRNKQQGSIFVALVGNNHDAHDFVAQAVENGAACVVVEKKIDFALGAEASQVVVEDTTKALGDLAKYRRKILKRESKPIVIGLTGSCGKTTVKEMCTAILKQRWPAGEHYPEEAVLQTKGNFNNLIGLPLSLLPLGRQTRGAVMEMGMNIKGEIKRLAEIADPDISCITNVHGAHLAGLGTIEGVASAKQELFYGTGKDSTLIINLDDPHVREMAGHHVNKQITFAVSQKTTTRDGKHPDVWATDIVHGSDTISFTLNYRGERESVVLHIVGMHNVSNALCAATIALTAGTQPQQIKTGLESFSPPDKRMEMLTGKTGFTLINDTYNANPASMEAGLRTLKQVGKNNTVAMVGDMLELGEDSKRAHRAIGSLIAELGITQAGVVGEFKDDLLQGALDNGYDSDRIKAFSSKEDATVWLQQLTVMKILGTNDHLLVKASRGLRFETIVAELL